MYEVESAIQKIQLWREHILRAVHQDTAKSAILQKMKPNQVLLIIDWAMKFLPVSYRETQSEWYGKKGRPWHVCTAIYKKPDGEYEEVCINCQYTRHSKISIKKITAAPESK